MLRHLNKPLYLNSNFRGFPWYDWQKLLWIQKCRITSFVALGMSEVNAQKMENQQLVSPSRQYSSTPVGFGFLSKEQSDKKWDIPHTLLAWLQRIFTRFLNWKSALKGWRRFCDATDVKNATEKLKRLSQNDFQECFQHLYSCWQKSIVAQGDHFEVNIAYMIYCFVCLKNNAIPQHFEATTYSLCTTYVRAKKFNIFYNISACFAQ